MCLIILTLASTSAFAQPPCFAFPANKKVYCVGEIVSVIDCFVYPPGSTIALANYDFIEVDTFKIPSSHIYTKPGKYKIEALGGSPQSRISDYVTILSPVPPTFTVRVCEGRKVSVVIQNPTSETYEFDFGDGPPISSTGTAAVVHTYPDVLPRTVKVKGQCSSYGPALNVTPIESLSSPQVTKLTQDFLGNAVTLEFKAISYFKYKIYRSYNGGSFDSVGAVSNKNGLVTFTLPTNGNNGQYCFKADNYDDCGALKSSPTVCTIESPSALAGNGQNVVSWISDAASAYKILLDNNEYTPSSPTTSSYTQNSVCGRDYYYSIKSTQSIASADVETFAVLLPVKGLSLATPAKVVGLNSTIVGSTVQLQWDKPTAFTVSKYRILRLINNGPYSQLAETRNNFFTDAKATFTNNRYCYKISYLDSCDNASDISLPTCPIILKTDNVTTNGLEGFKSEWTNYVGSFTNPSYTLEKIDFSNNVVESIPISAPDTISIDNNIDTNASGIRYRVKISQGTSVYYSNLFTIKFDARIFAPNAFTPNGDRSNDVFIVYGKYVKSFTMYIYNRWGEMVFSTKNIREGWDGTYQNKEATVDDYSYVIEAVDNEGKQFVEKGTVSVFR
jgi:gliding motility-associated-like protein